MSSTVSVERSISFNVQRRSLTYHYSSIVLKVLALKINVVHHWFHVVHLLFFLERNICIHCPFFMTFETIYRLLQWRKNKQEKAKEEEAGVCRFH